MKKLLAIVVLCLLFIGLSYSEEYKMPEIKPKDLVNDGYVLHSITTLPDEGPRVMLYTFTKNETKKIVSCVVELFDLSADLHICYNVTNWMARPDWDKTRKVKVWIKKTQVNCGKLFRKLVIIYNKT